MSNPTKIAEHIEFLIAKAAAADDSGDAMRLSQAALNAANTLSAIFSYNNLYGLPVLDKDT